MHADRHSNAAALGEGGSTAGPGDTGSRDRGMEGSAPWVITVEPCFADSPEGKVAAVTAKGLGKCQEVKSKVLQVSISSKGQSNALRRD